MAISCMWNASGDNYRNSSFFLWMRLWGGYHVPQNVFLVCGWNIFKLGHLKKQFYVLPVAFSIFYRAAWNAVAVERWEFCLSVRPSFCLSNACIVTKRKKAMFRFLLRCMECSRGIAMGILSVRPSVCQTRALWQNRRKLVQIFIPCDR